MDLNVPSFRGEDIQRIGFRYRSSRNEERSRFKPGNLASFYLALCYVKVYRAQPEPEFIYLSDARIPPIVRPRMVRHDARQLAGFNEDSDTVQLLSRDAQEKMARSPEETYYKYRGEDILKKSGLSYCIVRVSGYNESPSSEASTIGFKTENDEVSSVSRSEVAQVCVRALLDPSALNKSFYVTKVTGKSRRIDDDLHEKFDALPADATVV